MRWVRAGGRAYRSHACILNGGEGTQEGQCQL